MSTKSALDWVRQIQAEVGLADAPDPRPEMLSRLKAYPQLIEDKRRLMEALKNLYGATQHHNRFSHDYEKDADACPLCAHITQAVALLAELENR